MRSKSRSAPAAAAPSVDIKLTAFSGQEAQGILIASRQLPGYPTALGLLNAAFAAGADRILMDFTAAATVIRLRIDGNWENQPALDRPTGDAALFVLKRLMGMNPNDRRTQQKGRLIVVAAKGGDHFVDCTSAGVKTGERVMLEISPKKPKLKTLEDLGMREQMRERLREQLNGEGGIVLISAPPGHGLPTTWPIVLDAADKFVRDWVSLEPEDNPDPEVINVTPYTFDRASGQEPQEKLKLILLKQPDVFVMPELYNAEVAELLIEQLEAGKHLVTRNPGKDAVDATISFLMNNRAQAAGLLKRLMCVQSQRLFRKLCTTCRQPFTPSPQLLQKLGIPPGRVNQIYQPVVIPPGQTTDANGNQLQICPDCNGRGYRGRFAIFELLVLDDRLRKAVMQGAKNPDAIRKFAQESGQLGLREESLLAVITGQTSLQERERVLTAG